MRTLRAIVIGPFRRAIREAGIVMRFSIAKAR
jgi:hypothetical protein